MAWSSLQYGDLNQGGWLSYMVSQSLKASVLVNMAVGVMLRIRLHLLIGGWQGHIVEENMG